jgi:CDP-diacylglycerol---glycerol-3-phosphate 3-phosphatidyltransferase
VQKKKKNSSLLTISNSLSFIRAPLAFLFLQESTSLRLLAIFLAMITDSIDGYIARRCRSASRFGAILDPAMDKFFVYFAMAIFYLEGRITPLEMSAMLSRDFFLILYGFLLVVCGRWRQIEFRAIRWGKVTTSLQFIVLIALTLQIAVPWPIYALFLVMGLLAFVELIQIMNPFSASSQKI